MIRVFTPSERRIIEFLLTGDKTLSEVASHLRLSKPGTSKCLKNLEGEGILKSAYERTTEGRAVRYHLLPFHHLFSIDPDTKTAVDVTANDTFDPEFPLLGAIPQQDLRSEVKCFLEELRTKQLQDLTVVLYGSAALGSAARKSDIDLLLIKETWTKQEQEACYTATADCSQRIMHPIQPRLISLQELEAIDPVQQNEIRNHGIIVYQSGRSWKRIQGQLQKYKIITS